MQRTPSRTFESLAALDEWLDRSHMRGQWTREGGLPPEPKPFGVPHVWKWAAIRQGLDAASTLVPLDNMGVRRTIGLINPSLASRSGGSASPTLTMAVQLVNPGESALDHRHTPSASRFIVEGEVGAYTVVDGAKCTMERGDLVLTPNWSWHGHHNTTDRPVIWVDGLDVGLNFALSTVFFEPFPSPEGQQLGSPNAERSPDGRRQPKDQRPQLVFKWRDTLPVLEGLSADHDPHDARWLEYRDPATGGHTLPTFSCWIQLLERRQRTHAHRHTYTHLYHVFEGRGATEVDGQQLEWEQGDCFVIPNWTWHCHQNRDDRAPAILFSMNDLPVLEALGLLRDEQAK